jgi:hypothetical protein
VRVYGAEFSWVKGAFQTQLVPGYQWGIPEVPGLGAFQTQSRFISTQAGDAGWRSGGVYTGAFVPFIPHWRARSVAMRAGSVRVGSSCGRRISCAGGVWVEASCVGVSAFRVRGGGVLLSAGVAPGQRFPFAPRPAPARGPTTAVGTTAAVLAAVGSTAARASGASRCGRPLSSSKELNL